MNPAVIAVAITGSVPRKKDNPARADHAGRSRSNRPTRPLRPARASCISMCATPTRARRPTRRVCAVQEGMRKHCPGMIVQFSTGGRGRDQAARGSSLYLSRTWRRCPRARSTSRPSSMRIPQHSSSISRRRCWPTASCRRSRSSISRISMAPAAWSTPGLMDERPHVQFVMGVKNAHARRRAPARHHAERAASHPAQRDLDRRRHRHQPGRA